MPFPYHVLSGKSDSRRPHTTPVVFLICLTCALAVLAPLAVHANEDIWQGVYKYQLKLASHGNAEAQFKLGGMYEDGQGVPQNFDEARQWYEKAAAQGYQPAVERLRGLDARIAMAAERAMREQEARLAREQAEREAEQQRLEQERLAQEREQRRLDALREAEARKARAQAEAERLALEVEERKLRLLEEKEARRKAGEEAIKRAEKEWQEAVERRVAEERAHAEMMRQMAAPSAYEE